MEETLLQILQELKNQGAIVSDLNKRIADYENAAYFDIWIPRKIVMQFLNYGDTQMAALLKEGELIVSEVGARKFILKESFLNFLKKRIKKPL